MSSLRGCQNELLFGARDSHEELCLHISVFTPKELWLNTEDYDLVKLQALAFVDRQYPDNIVCGQPIERRDGILCYFQLMFKGRRGFFKNLF